MVDELSLLVDDSIPSVSESSSYSLPAPDFTGSLDYIDSLPSRSMFSLSQRDAVGITTELNSFDYLSPMIKRAVPDQIERSFNASTDFRPLQDGRFFDPQRSSRPLAALNRSSSRVVSYPRIKSHFPPGWSNPLDPSRSTDDLNRALSDIERRVNRHPFAFRRPNQVVICLKRKIRRNIMHAYGFAGYPPSAFRTPRRTYYSKVVC